MGHICDAKLAYVMPKIIYMKLCNLIFNFFNFSGVNELDLTFLDSQYLLNDASKCFICRVITYIICNYKIYVMLYNIMYNMCI
jgi:hypothetical protein